MVTPIILVGMNRSGTKWVSNILCSHDDVVGVQSERSRGILETNLFGAMQDKFDLSYPEEYVGFVELWARTEFFQLTGIDKEMFYSVTRRPRNALAMFDMLMSEFARKNNKPYWLQKTSPLRATHVLEYFKDARIVIVRRNLLDTVRSTLGMQSRHGRRRLVRATYAYVRQQKILDRISRTHRVVEMDYDRLRSLTSTEVGRLFKELGLDMAPEKTSAEVTYRKNTSFSNDSQRRTIMSPANRLLVKVLAGALRVIPLDLITISAVCKSRLMGRKPIPLLAGSFGSLVDRLQDRSRGAGD